MAAELTDEQVADLEERLFALLAEETDKKEDKNFWTVELVRPPGASTGLLAYIALAEAAIQGCVNLLGIGTTSPPPKVEDLIRPVVYENLGKGESTEAYKDTLTKVEARQGALLRADRNVVEIAKYVSSEEDQTLRAIKDIVGDLNGKLEAVGKAELKPAQEMELLRHLAEAVAAVQNKLTAVAELNKDMAGSEDDGDGKPGSGGGGAGSGGGGGDGGGIASMLPMLAMLPMMAMPLLNMVPELLENLNGEPEDGADASGAPAPESAPAPNDSPAQTDPRAAEAEQPNPDGTKAEGEPESPQPDSSATGEAVGQPAADPLGPLGPLVGAVGRGVRSALQPAAARPAADADDEADDAPSADDLSDDGLTEI
ncbi:hypothetical protein IU501_03375 [Nocardia otitidiscaviarum]|uniref:hypothetical protein n=1 Tax=Nocardia otitidiscaviarum TaxID=1823 RepID=UPI0004A752AF|nr:hypothetical protein [Nocardia otitidiscaviarum]MBF6132039.1 hypothetical protein [Nocardia otitidiscaviarum]MBF6483169.1 hypothetical protein [Nocardia otitidiscaviarum]